jgi:hypothetical protein
MEHQKFRQICLYPKYRMLARADRIRCSRVPCLKKTWAKRENSPDAPTRASP